MLGEIRAYFAQQGVLEVDTPLLGHTGAADPAIGSLALDLPSGRRYLQTSPEYAMKRLLAAGSGDIYQLCKAFREEEHSPLHRGEFTLLEWYRVGFDHHQLMAEVARLLAVFWPGRVLERLTIAHLAQQVGAPDPHLSSTAVLANYARDCGVVLTPPAAHDRSLLLDFLLTHLVRVGLPVGRAAFIYDFPLEQAAYARVRPGHPPVAERFELILDGVELANGYHELCDPLAQRARHAAEALVRAARGLPPPLIDERLLAALAAGLPACAGVALGIDRLLMLREGAANVGEVMAFGAETL